MTSFLSNLQKIQIDKVFDDLHDTFKRTIYAYKEAKHVTISTKPNYNSLFDQPNTQITKEKQEREIEARVYYFPKLQKEEQFAFDRVDGNKLQMEAGECRLKVSKDDYEWFKGVERVTFDNKIFRIISNITPEGMFSNNFYTIYMREVY